MCVKCLIIVTDSTCLIIEHVFFFYDVVSIPVPGSESA